MEMARIKTSAFAAQICPQNSPMWLIHGSQAAANREGPFYLRLGRVGTLFQPLEFFFFTFILSSSLMQK